MPTSVLDTVRNAIVHEDRELIVINKPAGLAVHGGSGLDFGVIEALRADRPGRVTRARASTGSRDQRLSAGGETPLEPAGPARADA